MLLVFNQRIPLVSALESVMATGVLCAAFIYGVSLELPLGQGPGSMLLLAVALFTAGQFVGLAVVRLYRVDHRSSLLLFAVRILGGLCLGGAAVFTAFSLIPELRVFQTAMPEALLLAATGLLLLRIAMVFAVSMDWLAHRVLILGTGQEASDVELALQSMARSGVTLVGFLPLGVNAAVAVDPERVITPLSSLEELVDRLRVDEVIVALQDQRGGVLPVTELMNCRLRGVRVTELSRFFERVTGEVPVNSLKASWLIYEDGFRQNWARRLAKRLFDIAAALVLLVLASPLMLGAAIAILIESGRPVVFLQERVGLGGISFMLFKFRSMRVDAERDGVPRWAASRDSRVTAVGRFIRRTRIDELPQIFNVLKGEMSFVGPRPERPFFVAQLTEQVRFYGARHSVKPGLTGWAQVRYSYGASVEDAVRKLQFDLFYVKNHTLLLDLYILLSTFRVVVTGQGVR